ncbi:MAG: S1 RNA-binding domain-containing protein, partial [Alphaproteobacteria bacterium]
PWTDFEKKYQVDSIIEGEIKNITEFGLFVGLTDDIDGMVHLSDLDWHEPGEEALKRYNKGDVIKAKVLDVDVDKERVSLGVKQLEDDPMEGAFEGIRRGNVVTCTVSAITEGGIEVMVNDKVPGFIRRTDLSKERSEQRPDRFAVGEKVDARITSIDRKDRRLSLSIKAQEAAEEKEAMQQYGSSDSGASLGDILGPAISKATENATEDSRSDENSEADAEEDTDGGDKA